MNVSEDKYRHVIKEYSRRAARYDKSGQRFLSLSQTVAVEILNPQRGERILDAGCGTGSAILKIAEGVGRNGEVVGIDICEDMLNAAKEKLSSFKNAILINGNLEDITYPDNYFDAVITINVMHYLHDIMVVLRKFYRLLKPNGRLVIVGFCTDYLFFRVVEKMWRIFIPSHDRAYSLDELSHKLKTAGFDIAKSERFKPNWFWRSMVIKGVKAR